MPASRNLRPARTAALDTQPSQSQRRSKRTLDTLSTAEASFDPLKNVIPIPTRLPLLAAELESIPSTISVDLFADLWPPVPSSFANTPGREWNMEKQMRAAGYSVELIMN